MPTESESFPAGPNSLTRYLETESYRNESFTLKSIRKFNSAFRKEIWIWLNPDPRWHQAFGTGLSLIHNTHLFDPLIHRVNRSRVCAHFPAHKYCPLHGSWTTGEQ
ncbi:hypothetical protein SAMN05216353_13744 [Halobacillus alkaliphilus]|uniref:Uncharacterized protein n=1 Tax=Halobacillus alkaliphilus TaxID=396056 RepID=A0A1I2R704_9BACI|nr:hypothetical protein SAMN05216353_13744 [Halobacillus alkaliphilus]